MSNIKCIVQFGKLLKLLKKSNKDHITLLTDLANKEDSKKQPETLVNMFRDVHGLAILYVVDSIVKNVGEPYVELFENSIVAMFKETFLKTLDAESRQKMYRLRQTWIGVFNEFTLECIDVAINNIDKAWPITVPNKAPISLVGLQTHLKNWKVAELQCLLVKLCKSKARTPLQSKKNDFIANICENPLVSVPFTNKELKTMIQLETGKAPRNETKDALEYKVKLLFPSFVNEKRKAFPNHEEWLDYVNEMAKVTKSELVQMSSSIGIHWKTLSLRQRVEKALEERNRENFGIFFKEYIELKENPGSNHKEIKMMLMRLNELP